MGRAVFVRPLRLTPNPRSTMKTESISGTIIHGTHRPQDLIPAFSEALSLVDPTGYVQWSTSAPFGIVPAYALEDDGADWWQSEDCQHTLETLFDSLDTAAPEGFYFGAHEADGSDFGFWQVSQ